MCDFRMMLNLPYFSHREKKLLVGSDDYGRDLTGVQNLRKKHKRLEAELSSHEPAIQVCKHTCGYSTSVSHTLIYLIKD